MKKELLTYSYEHQLGHVPSAMSMIDYCVGDFYLSREPKK